MPKGEPLPPREQLSSAEVGKRSHGAITTIVNNLAGIPEFNAGLHKAFFGRSFPRGGRSIIADGVFFQIGDAGYHVQYHAEPLRFSPREVQDYDANARLLVRKYDMGEMAQMLERPAPFADGQVAELELSTRFTENQLGQIQRFTGGNASVKEVEFNGITGVGSLQRASDSNAAFDSIPIVFSDLFPKVTI